MPTGHYIHKNRIIIPKRKLYFYYIIKNLSQWQVAKIFKCSSILIARKILKYKIKKNLSIANSKPKKTKFNQIITKEKLIQLYPKKIKYQRDIAKIFHCDRKIIEYYLKKYNIIRISTSERLKGANYTNGLGYIRYPSEFNNILREQVRKRDNYICQKCNKKQKNHYRKLDVHHIDYNKFNCKINNLITLCSDCNCNVNKNKDYWYAYFSFKMEKK
jgi:hypothetical protein